MTFILELKWVVGFRVGSLLDSTEPGENGYAEFWAIAFIDPERSRVLKGFWRASLGFRQHCGLPQSGGVIR
jgi:hypothetical protein